MSQPTISELIAAHTPSFTAYEALYRKLHANPELPYQESETAATIADWLRSIAGFEVKTSIGGHGVVGILRNERPSASSPTSSSSETDTKTQPIVLLRAELDALPLLETTGLPFASTKTMPSHPNSTTLSPVMHACGHDLHMCAQLAACHLLSTLRPHWSGTVIAIFQPAEETGLGAKSMYDSGLFDPLLPHSVPTPTVALGGHCMPLRAGQLKTKPGVINASCDNIRVTIHGRGGHGSRPHTTVDPVVLAATIIVNLQTVVSRHVNPLETAVLTVGSVHSGTAANIIPETAVLELNLRAFKPEIRKQLLDWSRKYIEAECTLWSCPKPPLFERIGVFPIVDNDEVATLRVSDAFERYFGERGNYRMDALQSAGSEDFAALFGDGDDGDNDGDTDGGEGRGGGKLKVPIVFWNYGCIDPEVWDEAEREGTLGKVPGNHSAGFKPVVQPSLKVGMEAYVVAALAYLRDE